MIIITNLIFILLFDWWNWHASTWQNIWQVVGALIGAAVAIVGVMLTLKRDREQNDKTRKQLIKPVIFAEYVGVERYPGNRTPKKDLFEALQVFANTDNSYPISNALKFRIKTFGDLPAKDIRIEEFKIFDLERKIFIFGETSPVTNKFFEKSLPGPFETDIPINGLPGEEFIFTVNVQSFNIEPDIFIERFMSHDLSHESDNRIDKSNLARLFKDKIQVTAIFSYTDIDGNFYDDLKAAFYVGLTTVAKSEIGMSISNAPKEAMNESDTMTYERLTIRRY